MAPPTSTGQFTYTIVIRQKTDKKLFSLCKYSNGVCIPNTVKLGNKDRFDKEQIGIKEPFPETNLPFT